MKSKTAAFGIYHNRSQAEHAVDKLVGTGFHAADISVLYSESQGTKDFAHKKSTKAPEGAAAGATTGAVAGGALGLLAGLGAIAIPGVGPLIAAGPIMATLAGMGTGGAVGGLVGALAGAGVPEYEAKRYEGFMKKGGILLSVHCEDSEKVSQAKELLKKTGAEDIAATSEATADVKTN
jgi:hypothetical protein